MQSICTALLAALLSAPGFAQTGPDYSIHLTAKTDDGVPSDEASTEFGCTEQIYAVLTLTGLPRRRHDLEAVWRDPHGKDREHTKYPFTVRYDQERIWVWLKLHRSTESSLVQFVDPSAGMEGFVGEWRVTFHLDGELIGEQLFNVIC